MVYRIAYNMFGQREHRDGEHNGDLFFGGNTPAARSTRGTLPRDCPVVNCTHHSGSHRGRISSCGIPRELSGLSPTLRS